GEGKSEIEIPDFDSLSLTSPVFGKRSRDGTHPGSARVACSRYSVSMGRPSGHLMLTEYREHATRDRESRPNSRTNRRAPGVFGNLASWRFKGFDSSVNPIWPPPRDSSKILY